MVGQSYIKEDMVKQINAFYNKHGKIVVRDLKSANNLPTISGIIFIWGSFQNCLKELGIFKDSHCFNRECKTDEQMLDELRDFTTDYLKTHLFLPVEADVEACKSLSSVSTYTKRFGSLNNAYNLIGYSDDFNHNCFLKDIKNKYIKCCKIYGKTLNSREIDCLSKKDEMYATATIINNFGSLSNFQKECGLIPTMLGRSISQDEVLDLLLKLKDELGRTPLQEDVIKCEWLPSPNYFHKYFGGYKEALNLIGLKTSKTCRSESGVKCNSQYELKIANALENHNVSYEKEVQYKTVIPDFPKAYRFDFAIEKDNVKYYIEFFGITGVHSYEEKTKEKIELCRNNSINLISLFPEDIYSKSYDDVYNLIMDKCKEITKLKNKFSI